MSASRVSVSVCAAVGLLVSTAKALNVETVPVDSPGNAGELSGSGAGGPVYGPDRICGAVSYTYSIGKYEVTAGQYTAFLNAVVKTDPYGLYNTNMWSNTYGCRIQRSGSSGSFSYTIASDYANRPVNFVSYWDACRFANWLHNSQPSGAQGAGTTERGAYTIDGHNGPDGGTIQRNTNWQWAVTSEDEWYKAAYYNPATSSYYDYPSSSNTAPGRDIADVSGNNANYYAAPYTLPLDPPYYTTVVGEFQNSDSPYGTFDQGGNMWEWNEAKVLEGVGYAFRGVRGGSFYGYDQHFYDYLHAAGRYYGYPEYEYGYVGFRVVQVPEPATLLLLAFGGLAVMRRR